MKNRDIMTLCNGGFFAATAHSLPTEHFYKFFKFKRDVIKANRNLAEMQEQLINEFDIRNIKDEEDEKINKFHEANNKVLSEDADVTVKSRIPFEFYKGIYDENRETSFVGQKVDIFADPNVEAIILDQLFEPDE